ncbi:phage virion morphogenesis protein [Salmonella enterica]|nr:phage virion morphogenesis protein [Salmonella enterica]EGL4359901.1 phage virion morphogenesis protein [Salmonella enterica]EGL4382860.1 phage virion morphogenesis protein [Salmonella enterica]EGL4488136.1 phage virion morphogenesis protein [Salmonella enterica]EGL4515268.1 phage virion morphogenesis protein [Salmonella enterica]
MYRITIDTSAFEAVFKRLLNGLEDRRDLMKSLAADMHDAVEENFAQQGRPAWQAWSKSYARQAAKRGQEKILQRRGRLADSIHEASDNDSATVGTNVKYAAIHQYGGTITMPARSQRAYYRQYKDGRVGHRFVRKSQSNFSQWHTLPAYHITLPARPFLALDDSDIRQMGDTLENYLRRLTDD